ncbi:MAG: response regulator transcription factor [Bacteroidetes bacterium]|nr:response regulator transcription factor [Bacteroidota bacterium]
MTKREKEVLLLILQDHSSQSIATELKLSIRTVETHRKHIIKKTDSRSLVSLFKYAIQSGLMAEYYYKPLKIDKNNT